MNARARPGRWIGSTMAESRGWLHRTGWLLPLLAGAALIAFAYQVRSPLPDAYTWLRPLGHYSLAMFHPYAPTGLVGAFLIGRAAALGGARAFLLDLRQRLDPACVARRAPLAVINAALALTLWWTLSPAPVVMDALALVAFAVWSAPEAEHATTDEGRGAARHHVVEGAVLALVLTVVSYVYTVLKAEVLRLGAPVDAELVAWQARWFGEPLHRIMAAHVATHSGLVWLTDQVYFRLFEHITVTAAFLAGLGRGDLRDRYIAALTMTYLLGGLGYHVWPLLGPVYHDPAAFAYLFDQPLKVTEVQEVLRSKTAALADGTAEGLQTYSYIAALPSLHMANATIVTFYSRASRPFVALQGVAWSLTFAAVLVLGWHYVEDVLAGLVLAAVAIAIAEAGGDRWMPAALRLGRAPTCGRAPRGA